MVNSTDKTTQQTMRKKVKMKMKMKKRTMTIMMMKMVSLPPHNNRLSFHFHTPFMPNLIYIQVPVASTSCKLVIRNIS